MTDLPTTERRAALLRADHPAQGVAMGEPSPEIVLLLTTARVLRAQTKIRTVGDEYPGDSEDLEALNEALAPFDPIAPPAPAPETVAEPPEDHPVNDCPVLNNARAALRRLGGAVE